MWISAKTQASKEATLWKAQDTPWHVCVLTAVLWWVLYKTKSLSTRGLWLARFTPADTLNATKPPGVGAGSHEPHTLDVVPPCPWCPPTNTRPQGNKTLPFHFSARMLRILDLKMMLEMSRVLLQGQARFEGRSKAWSFPNGH